MKQYKGQETFRIESVSYVKLLEQITCKRTNMDVRSNMFKLGGPQCKTISSQFNHNTRGSEMPQKAGFTGSNKVSDCCN